MCQFAASSCYLTVESWWSLGGVWPDRIDKGPRHNIVTLHDLQELRGMQVLTYIMNPVYTQTTPCIMRQHSGICRMAAMQKHYIIYITHRFMSGLRAPVNRDPANDGRIY